MSSPSSREKQLPLRQKRKLRYYGTSRVGGGAIETNGHATRLPYTGTPPYNLPVTTFSHSSSYFLETGSARTGRHSLYTVQRYTGPQRLRSRSLHPYSTVPQHTTLASKRLYEQLPLLSTGCGRHCAPRNSYNFRISSQSWHITKLCSCTRKLPPYTRIAQVIMELVFVRTVYTVEITMCSVRSSDTGFASHLLLFFKSDGSRVSPLPCLLSSPSFFFFWSYFPHLSP